MPALRPLITLATDFGESSPYVAMLKGRLLERCPQARLLDLGHHLPGDDLFAAAFFLLRVCFYYPAGTVHLVGVDRGHGRDRALLAASGGQRFVAMDNGVLGLVLGADAAVRSVGVAPRTTFTARDVLVDLALAEACPGRGRRAAHRPPALPPAPGPVPVPAPTPVPINDWLRLELPSAPQVLHVDCFGNLLVNLRVGAPVQAVAIAGHVIGNQHRHYGQAAADELFWYWGAEGWLEIALAGGSAARRLAARRGTPVEVR